MLVQRGARMWVELLTPEADIESAAAMPASFTGRCEGSALIDTGAMIGAVDTLVVEQLQLIPVREIEVRTTGGRHDASTYIVGLRVGGVALGTVELAAAEGLAKNGFVVLLGREFLVGRLFVYDGRTGAYRVESDDAAG